MSRSHSFRSRRASLSVEALEDRNLLTVGNLDLAFGQNGLQLFQGGPAAQINSLVLFSDGDNTTPDSFVAVGQDTQQSLDFALIPYDPNGNLQGSPFLFDFNGGDDGAMAAIQEPGGKTLLAGFATQGGNRDFALMRFDDALNGIIDNNFGTAGQVVLDLGGMDVANAVAITPTNEIVVVGTSTDQAGNQDLVVARFLQNGTVDNSFGNNGIVRIDLSNRDTGKAIAVLNNGQILAAGEINDDLAVLRLDADGTLDTTFGTNGITSIDFLGETDQATGLAVQENGSIIVSGTAQEGRFTFIALGQLTADGQLDASFGAGSRGPAGTVLTSVEAFNDVANAVAIQPNGQIVVAGFAQRAEIEPNKRDFSLVRYFQDGTLDDRFGLDGRIITSFAPVSADPTIGSAAFALAVTDNGQLLAGGSTENDGLALARYQADIRPIAQDDSFNFSTNNGNNQKQFSLVSNDFDTDPQDAIVVESLTINGTVVPTGVVHVEAGVGTFSTDGALVTFDPDPLFDGTFNFTYSLTDQWLSSTGNVSISVTPFQFRAGDLDLSLGGADNAVLTQFGNGDDRGNAIAVQQNDGQEKTIVVGGGFNGQTTDVAIARYLADGTLDATFGNAGRVSLDIGLNGLDEAFDVLIQDDQKIVVAGFASNGNDEDFLIARFDVNGALDTTFGANGITRIDFGGTNERALTLLAQNGSFILGGFVDQGANRNFALARVDANGILDQTFGIAGITITDASPIGGADEIRDLVLLPDGTILAGGFARGAINNDSALANYTANGILNPAFGVGGITTVNVGGTGDDLINALVVTHHNGNTTIYAALFSTHGTGQRDIALSRFTLNGNFDNTFANDGMEVTDFAGGTDEARDLLLLNDNTLLLVGLSSTDPTSAAGQPQDFAAARFDLNGNLDATFGNGGLVSFDFANNNDQAMSVVQLANGNFVLAGVATTATSTDFGLVQLNNNGTVNAGFGGPIPGPGVILFGDAGPLSPGDSPVQALAVQADGNILVGGTLLTPFGFDFAVARLTPDGDLDPTFGNNGIALIDTGGEDFLEDLIILSTGQIAIAGTTELLSDPPSFSVAVLDANGNPDLNFNGTGTRVIDVSPINGDDEALAIVEQGGRIVLGGFAETVFSGSDEDFALVRLNLDGTLDTTFGVNGITIEAISIGDADKIFDLDVQSDQKIIAAGFAINGGTKDFVVARFDTAGSLDPTFNTVGFILTDFGDNTGDDQANAIVVLPNDQIIAAGSATSVAGPNAGTLDVALAKYNADNGLDNTFGTGGLSLFDSPFDFVANALAVDPQGQPVFSGSVFIGSPTPFNNVLAVGRANPDGSPDTTFGGGNNGRTAIAIPNGDGEFTGVAIEANGSIIASGFFAPPGGSTQFVLARFHEEATGNLIPLANNDTSTTVINGPVEIPVVLNDIDPDLQTLTITGFSTPGNGTVLDNLDGTLTYTPNNGFQGVDNFSYTITDGTDFDTATVTVNVVAPPDLTAALAPFGNLVTAARFINLSAQGAAGVYDRPMAAFPAGSPPSLLLTTGNVSVPVDNRDAGIDNKALAPNERGLAFDPVVLELTLNIPAGVNYLSFDFVFATNEFPLFLQQGFNDGFIAELDQTTWSVDPQTGDITAPENFAFDIRDPDSEAITVDDDFFSNTRVVTQLGNFYNAGTPRLNAGTPITPGQHTLYLSIFDVGDGQIDSGVFIQNLRVSNLPAEALREGAIQPPLARDDWAPLVPGQATDIPVLANDLELDLNTVLIVAVDGSNNADVTIGPDGLSVIYDPNPGFNGNDTFTYTIQDERGQQSTATVQVFPLVVATQSLTTTPTGAQVTPASGIVTGTLTNNTPGSQPVFLTVSSLAGNTENVPFDSDVFFDVLAPDTNASDQVTLFINDPTGQGQLFYFTGAAFEPVRSSGNIPPIRLPDGRLMVVLDDTSQPRITGLTGTVFTLPAPTPMPSSPSPTPFSSPGPLVTTSTPPTTNGNLNFLNNVQLSIGLTASDSTDIRSSNTQQQSRSQRDTIQIDLALSLADSTRTPRDLKRRATGSDDGPADLDLLWLWELDEEMIRLLNEGKSQDPEGDEENPLNLIPPAMPEEEGTEATEESEGEEGTPEPEKSEEAPKEQPQSSLQRLDIPAIHEEATPVSSHLAWAAFLATSTSLGKKKRRAESHKDGF